MGCISSTQNEATRPHVDIDTPPQNANSNEYNEKHNNPLISEELISEDLDIQQTASLQDWNTNDLISYLCSIENGKFAASQYDVFYAGLQALGINGLTINTLCYDANVLRDLGLSLDHDIITIQTKMVELYANNDTKAKDNQNKSENENEKEEFFPEFWTFPLMDDVEKIKNNHYIGQKLLIRSLTMQHQIGVVIYVENNWIVIKYKYKNNNICNNKSKIDELSISLKSNDTNTSNSILVSPTNNDNIFKNMERLHIIQDMARISKLNAKNNNGDEQNGHFRIIQGDGDFFNGEKEYGMSSCYSTSNSIIGVVVPNCYIDPITYEIMTHPMTSISSGRTYDKKIILQHLQNYGTDPFSQLPMKKTDLYHNIHLKRAIHRWLKNNPNVTTM